MRQAKWQLSTDVEKLFAFFFTNCFLYCIFTKCFPLQKPLQWANCQILTKNTLYGKSELNNKTNILDENNLINCSNLLQRTEIKHADFSEILKKVKKGDFVYFDPPYVPLSETSSFTSYTKDGFDIDMQFKLRDVCDELDSMGVKFLLSNSDTKLVNELYENYNIKKVFASRQINANADGRGKITEVMVRNY